LAISKPFRKETRHNISSDYTKPFIINYSDSLCGAGKTEEAINQIAKLLDHVIYAVPTTSLAESVEDRMKDAGYENLGFQVIRIDGITHSNETVERLLVELKKDIGNKHIVVICTHASLKTILASCYIPNGSWSLYIDEPLNVVDTQTIKSDTNLSIYTDLFKPISALEEIKEARGKTELVKDIYNNTNTDAVFQSKELKKLCGYVSSKKHSVSALKTIDSAKIITYISYLKPDSMQEFKSVTMLAAKFKDTLIYQLWSKEIEFKSCNWSQRFKEHKNGKNVSLYYLLKHDDKEWTSGTLDKFKNLKEIQRNTIAGVSKEIIKNKHRLSGVKVCLLRANSFLYSKSRTPDKSFLYVSGMPFGLNSYDHINAAAYLQTQMPSNIPTVRPWYKGKNITSKEKRATYHSEAYQMIMRCSLRDPSNNSDVVIVVGDKGTADYIADQFEDRPEPKYYQLKALEQVDTKRGVVGQPKSEELDVGEKTKRWMSRKLKKANKSMPIGTTSVGLMVSA
jgi:hypothetical protein